MKNAKDTCSAMVCAFTANVHAAIAPASHNRFFPYFFVQSITDIVSDIIFDVRCMPSRIIGRSLSPRLTASSWKFFFALSSCACTVLFFTSNSCCMLVPSLYALFASSWRARTSSIFPATADSTPTARCPFRCISSNIGARLSKPPRAFIASKNCSSAALAFVRTSSENC